MITNFSMFKIKSNFYRTVILFIIYLLSNKFIYDKHYKFPIVIGFCAAMVEVFYIWYIPNSWNYHINSTNFLKTIPTWLIPLWSIAILYILILIDYSRTMNF